MRTVRRTLAQLHETGRLEEDGKLVVGEERVAVVYLRSGYSPNDYPTDNEWAARWVSGAF